MKKIIILLGLICISISSLRAQTAGEVEQIRSQANMGNAEAQFELAFCYINGLGGLPVDYAEAVKWVRKSAAKGYAVAECSLGIYYEIGIEGVITPDPEEAVKWYKKSAGQGYAEAQFYLGNCFLNGAGGLTQSNEEAVKWYKKSAEQDFLQAEAMLGIYYKNMGDRTTALYWFEKAYTTAKESRKELEKEMLEEFDENFTKPLEVEINEMKKPAVTQATYLTASSTSLYFNSGGSTSTITVSTDGASFDVSLLPSWCSVVNKTNNSFQIVCQSNSGAVRKDWFKVKSDDKEVRIEVEQAAGAKTPSAEFGSIRVVHNVFENPYNIFSRKGMQIYINFSVSGMLNKQGDCVVWFYFENGNILKDYNGAYRASDGQVATSSRFKSTYENARWDNFVIFMPYDELHLSRGSHSLKFKIGLFDHNDRQMETSDYIIFTYSGW